MVKPYLKDKRREKSADLTVITVSLPTALVDALDRYGINSHRGGGNMSVFLEIAAYIVIGLFTDPEIAIKHLVRLFRNDDFAPGKIEEVTQNMEVTVKLLVD